VYPPVTVPEAENRLPDLPEEKEVMRKFAEVTEKLRG
jgi:hypothetical protein